MLNFSEMATVSMKFLPVILLNYFPAEKKYINRLKRKKQEALLIMMFTLLRFFRDSKMSSFFFISFGA